MKLTLFVALLVVCAVAQRATHTATANEAEKAIVKLLTTGPSANLIDYVEDLNKNHYSLDKVLFYAPKIEALVPGLVDEFFQVMPLLKQAAPGMADVIAERERHLYKAIVELRQHVPAYKHNGLKVVKVCPVASTLNVNQSQVNTVYDIFDRILRRIRIPAGF
jgi:hypothetical protein